MSDRLASAARCLGCALEGVSDGPRHDYIGASAYCWERYGELLDLGHEQLVVDTYAAQHPGEEGRRSVQSVAIHLMSLCGHFERNVTPENAPDLMRQALDLEQKRWRWLPIEQPVGTVTVADVVDGRCDVATWSTDVWDAWAPFHNEIRDWLDDVWTG